MKISPLRQKLLQRLYTPYKGRVNMAEILQELNEAEKELDERLKGTGKEK